MPARRTSRSTTTSIVWFSYRSSCSLASARSMQLTVDPGAGEALPGQLVEQAVVLALAAPHDRREHLEARAVRRAAARGRRSAAASGG